MKKKIFIILIAIISLSSLSTVYADDCAKTSPRLSVIPTNNKYDTELTIYYMSSGVVQSATKGTMRFQKINGNWALCLHLGWSSNSTLSFEPTRFSDNDLSVIQQNHYRKAYKYVTDNVAGDSDLSYMVAQLAVWISTLNNDGTIPKNMLVKSTTSAYCAIKTYYYAKLGCDDGDDGFLDTEREYGDKIKDAVDKYYSTSFYNGSNLGIYYSNDKVYAQPLLSKYVCNPTCESTNSCATAAEQNVDRKEDGTCNYDYGYDVDTTVVPTSCTSGVSSGFVNDINDWGCIFDSAKQANPIKTRYLEDNSNSYCTIYCRQQVIATLPSEIVSVGQGRYMTVGSTGATNISPIVYEGVKTCRPTSSTAGSINISQFLSDLSSANNQVQNAWNNAQQKLAEYNAANNARYVGEHLGDCRSGRTLWEEDYSECRKSAAEDAANYVKLHPAESGSLSSIEANYYNNCLNNTPKHCGNENDSDYWTIYEYAGSGSNGVYHGSASFEFREDSSPTPARNSYWNSYNQAINNYNNAVSSRNRLIDKINSCTTLASGINYNDFEPQLTFNYEEPTYGNMGATGWSLKKSLNTRREITYYKGGSSVLGTSTFATTDINNGTLKSNVSIKTCNSQGYPCWDGTTQYYSTTWWEMIYTKQYTYELSDGIYRYIEKGSGQSVHTKVNPSLEYTDLGFSNLPIHYSTAPGNYDYTITTTTFGPGNRFNTATLLPSVYTCEYNVSCNKTVQHSDGVTSYPTCPGKTIVEGLNVIYRTISLNSKKEAFPGINGTGRTPGENWNNDTLINNYIVNNRGVADYEVYHLDPLYEIELTPALMKTIRQYNKKQNSITITMYSGTSSERFGIAGYSDFSNMTCRSGGTHCVSSLLRGNVTGYNAIKVTGCAISGSGSYRNCGSRNEAW